MINYVGLIILSKRVENRSIKQNNLSIKKEIQERLTVRFTKTNGSVHKNCV